MTQSCHTRTGLYIPTIMKNILRKVKILSFSCNIWIPNIIIYTPHCTCMQNVFYSIADTSQLWFIVLQYKYNPHVWGIQSPWSMASNVTQRHRSKGGWQTNCHNRLVGYGATWKALLRWWMERHHWPIVGDAGCCLANSGDLCRFAHCFLLPPQRRYCAT